MKEIGHVVGFTIAAGFFALILLGGAYEFRVWWEDRQALARADRFEALHLARQDAELAEQEDEIRADEWAREQEQARMWNEWAETLEQIRSVRFFDRDQWERRVA